MFLAHFQVASASGGSRVGEHRVDFPPLATERTLLPVTDGHTGAVPPYIHSCQVSLRHAVDCTRRNLAQKGSSCEDMRFVQSGDGAAAPETQKESGRSPLCQRVDDIEAFNRSEPSQWDRFWQRPAGYKLGVIDGKRGRHEAVEALDRNVATRARRASEGSPRESLIIPRLRVGLYTSIDSRASPAEKHVKQTQERLVRLVRWGPPVDVDWSVGFWDTPAPSFQAPRLRLKLFLTLPYCPCPGPAEAKFLCCAARGPCSSLNGAPSGLR
jgi:hypothetical protein